MSDKMLTSTCNAGRAAVTHNKFIPNIEKTANDFVAYLNQQTFSYKILNYAACS